MKIRNKVLERLNNNQPCLGGWVMSSSVMAAEILAQAGFDWVCVDAEHSPVDFQTVRNMFVAIERHGSEPFIRVSDSSEFGIKQSLDLGAKGIIIPMVKSAEEVEQIIAYASYAPQGCRSFAITRASGHGAFSNEYFSQINDQLFIGIMIEHIDSLPHLDKIFMNKRIDTVFVGPYDLSGSMNIPGQFDNKEFKKVLDQIHSKAREYGINMGIHEVYPTREKIRGFIESGYKFIACGVDTLYLREMAEKFASILKA